MTTPKQDSLRVVVFTAVGDAVPNVEPLLTAKGHRLVGLVGAPGPRSRRTDDYLALGQYARPGLDVIISNYPNRWADMIRPIRPDLIVCFGFNWKIPADVLQIPRLGTINLHDGLLPKYRGRCATGWALRNEDEYGLTFHYMGTEFDTGPILSQRRVSYTDDDYSFPNIWSRFAAAAEEAFLEALDRVAAGDPGTVQDETLATTAPGAFEPEWRFLDWTKPARDTFIQVRSWYGARGVPLGALAQIDGRQVLITATRLIGQQSNDAAPGTVLERRDDGSLLVQCGDGPLEILIWQEEPPMSANGSGTMDPLLVAVSDPS
ncbi:hypothetical protein BH24CHL1_BH24CHL1_02240 [soil metagenome]